MKNSPIAATLVAVVLALIVNIFYYSTGTGLTHVVSRTLFADLLLVLTLVPIYQAIVVRNSSNPLTFIDNIKSGMKPVAMYTFLVAVITYFLFANYGDPLVAERMSVGVEDLRKSVAEGIIDQEEMDQRIEGAKQFYSISFYLPIVLLTNLFVGFLSSILAGVLIKK